MCFLKKKLEENINIRHEAKYLHLFLDKTCEELQETFKIQNKTFINLKKFMKMHSTMLQYCHSPLINVFYNLVKFIMFFFP